MEEYQIRRVPVIDQSGRLVGIISQADVATRFHGPLITAGLVEEISRAA
jgi:CBS domain-containing protein